MSSSARPPVSSGGLVPFADLAVLRGAAQARELCAAFFWPTPSLGHGLLIMGMGAVAATGHALLIRAYKYASPAVVSPFSYGQLVWAALFG